MRDKRDEEAILTVLPVARTVIAVLLKLRYGTTYDVTHCYTQADQFINQFKKDLAANG